MRHDHLFIGGQWVESESGEVYTRRDPATGNVVSRHDRATRAEAERAITAAREAFDRGGNACAALNGANEAAVAAFLAGRLGYLELFELVARAADEVPYIAEPSLEDILETDRAARAYVNGGCI